MDCLRKTICVDKLFLYGSYAQGNPREYSDIDVAVVSKDFGKQTHYDDLVLLSHAAYETDHWIQARPYSHEQFDHCLRGSFLDEIIRTGKLVYDGDTDTWYPLTTTKQEALT